MKSIMMKMVSSILILLAAVIIPCSARAELKAGTAKAEITPAVGCYLGGYYFAGRSTGVHDPLHTRVLALNDGTNTIVLISNDLIMTGGVFANDIKQEIQKRTGVPPSNVVISAVHTHTGPEGYYEEFGKYPKEYLPEMKLEMESKIVAAVGEAINKMVPAQAGTLVFEIGDFSHNRHDGTLIDKRVVLLVVRDMAGNPIGGFLNFAAHPIMAPAEQQQMSADWPGVFTVEVEKYLGGGSFLLLQGAVGNITPAGAKGDDGWQQLTDYGTRLAGVVLGKFDSVQTTSDFPLAGRLETMVVPVRSARSASEYRKQIPEKTKQIQASGMSKDEQDQKIGWMKDRAGLEAFLQPMFKTMKRVVKGRTETCIQAMRLGDTLLVAYPGEVVTELSQKIRDDLAPRKVVVLGLANDHLAYLTTQKIYDEGGYEAGMSLVYPQTSMEMTEKLEGMALSLAAK